MDMQDDHDHDHGGGSDGGSVVSCPMIMVFHGGHCERILWAGWVASTVAEFAFSCLAFFVMAFLYEGLKFVREYLKRQAMRREAERVALEAQAKNQNGHAPSSHAGASCSNTHLAEMREKPFLQRILNGPHLVQTLINLVQIVMSYLLMLVFMNFNYWLCLSVVLGLGLGYFFFGWIRLDAYEHDCCQ